MKKIILVGLLSCILGEIIAQVQQLQISNGDILLNAFLYQASEAELKPTVIWCHGNPGSPVDGQSKFALNLNKKGINVLRFNYQGLWGTKGEYTIGNCQKDLVSVLDYIYQEKISSKYRIDTSRIIVAGHSHGSFVTITTALFDQRIKEFICLGLADIGFLIRESLENPHNLEMMKFHQEIKDEIWGDANWGPGKFAPDYDKYFLDVLFNNYKYNFVAQADKLKNKRLLVIIGMNDVTVPIEDHFFPLYRRLKEMNHSGFQYGITQSDHSFSEMYDGRLSSMIAEWINRR